MEKTSKPGVLVAGGGFPEYHRVREILRSAYRTAAADSGMDVLVQWGERADIWVGDMDSTLLGDGNTEPGNGKPEGRIPESSYPAEKRVFPRDKDKTDTELAMDELVAAGCDTIYLLGGGGGRMDHLLALYFLFLRRRAPLLREWISDTARVIRIDGEWEIHGAEGREISFFPLEDGCRMTSSGLRWNLDGLEWSLGDGGISNRIDRESCSVTMEHGSLAAVMNCNKEGRE